MTESKVEQVPEVPPSTSTFSASKDKENGRDNGIGNTLQVVGILVGILGGFAGVFVGMGSGIRHDGNWSIAIPVIISAGLSCLVFLGFAEIVFLLAKIAHNTSK